MFMDISYGMCCNGIYAVMQMSFKSVDDNGYIYSLIAVEVFPRIVESYGNFQKMEGN
jgi:hypothetical protein